MCENQGGDADCPGAGPTMHCLLLGAGSESGLQAGPERGEMSRAHGEEGSKVVRVRARAGACHVASRYVPTPASPPGAGTPGAGVEPRAVSAGRFECNSSLCRRERPGGKANRISAGRHLSPSSQGLWASPAGSSSVPALPGSVRSVLGSGPLGRRPQQQSWLI